MKQAKQQTGLLSSY